MSSLELLIQQPQLKLNQQRRSPVTVEEDGEILEVKEEAEGVNSLPTIMRIPTVYQSEAEAEEGESQTLVTMTIQTVYQSGEEAEDGEVNILKAMIIPTVYPSTSEGGDTPEEIGYLALST